MLRSLLSEHRCTLGCMGETIPDWFFNVIAERFKAFVEECLRNGGQPDLPLLLEYAVHAAQEDVEAICMKLLGGTARHDPQDFMNAIFRP